MNKTFKASNGAEIEFLPGFFEQKNDWPFGIKDFHEFVQKCWVETAYPKGIIGFFLGKVLITQYFIEVMKNTFCQMPTWNRMLDIGTGPGIPPRLMKAFGYVKEAWATDILDRRGDYPDEMSVGFIRDLQVAISKRDKTDLEILKNVVMEYKENYTQIPLALDAFRPGAVDLEKFTWDNYLVGDFIEDDMEFPKFDLITGFLCLDYFKTPQLFKKVDSLLEKNGVFFFNVTNWYNLWGGAMQIPMDAPWFHARVSKADLLAYYKECRPEIYEDTLKAVYMKSTHMTYRDFVREGEKVNFEFKGFRRTIDTAVMTSLYFNSYDYLHNPVLAQAQKINPLVCLEDLLTKNITLVFQKK